MTGLQRVQLPLEVRARGRNVRRQRIELLEYVNGGAGGEQVAAVGRAVVAGEDLRGHMFGNQRGANRHA